MFALSSNLPEFRCPVYIPPKHLPHVETHLYCPHTLLSSGFQREDDVSEEKKDMLGTKRTVASVFQLRNKSTKCSDSLGMCPSALHSQYV